jgi:hypothetical protein
MLVRLARCGKHLFDCQPLSRMPIVDRIVEPNKFALAADEMFALLAHAPGIGE